LFSKKRYSNLAKFDSRSKAMGSSCSGSLKEAAGQASLLATARTDENISAAAKPVGFAAATLTTTTTTTE
jgi:hypothetical protein